MELVNATMYHYKDKRRKSEKWLEGNEFIISKDYKSYECEQIVPIDKNLSLIDKKIEYYTLLKNDNKPLKLADRVNIREKMLELYRSTYCPNEISRMNCMFFCDEQSVVYWDHMFPSYYDLYEVVLNGEAFKTSSKLLPILNCNRSYTYEEFFELCKAYWNPNLMDENLCCFSEYLFQGSVYVKEKLDKEVVRSRYIFK